MNRTALSAFYAICTCPLLSVYIFVILSLNLAQKILDLFVRFFMSREGWIGAAAFWNIMGAIMIRANGFNVKMDKRA